MERARPNTPALPGISISEPSSSPFLVIGDNECVSLPASFLRSRNELGDGRLSYSFISCSTLQRRMQHGANTNAARCLACCTALRHSGITAALSQEPRFGAKRMWLLSSCHAACDSGRGECAIAGALIRGQKDASPFEESCSLGIARTRLLNPKILIRNSPQACNYSRWMTLPLA